MLAGIFLYVRTLSNETVLNQFAPSQIALVELLQALVAIQQTCVLSIIRILSTHLVVNGSFAAIRKLVVVSHLKIYARL